MQFKKTNTKLMWISHVTAAIIIIFFVNESIFLWEGNNLRAIELLLLVGMVMEVLGFVVLLRPQFIRLINDQEVDFTYEGILYILAGLVFQIIVIYFFR